VSASSGKGIRDLFSEVIPESTGEGRKEHHQGKQINGKLEHIAEGFAAHKIKTGDKKEKREENREVTESRHHKEVGNVCSGHPKPVSGIIRSSLRFLGKDVEAECFQTGLVNVGKGDNTENDEQT